MLYPQGTTWQLYWAFPLTAAPNSSHIYLMSDGGIQDVFICNDVLFHNVWTYQWFRSYTYKDSGELHDSCIWTFSPTPASNNAHIYSMCDGDTHKWNSFFSVNKSILLYALPFLLTIQPTMNHFVYYSLKLYYTQYIYFRKLTTVSVIVQVPDLCLIRS